MTIARPNSSTGSKAGIHIHHREIDWVQDPQTAIDRDRFGREDLMLGSYLVVENTPAPMVMLTAKTNEMQTPGATTKCPPEALQKRNRNKSTSEVGTA